MDDNSSFVQPLSDDDWARRREALSLDHEALQRHIPHGPYCYSVLQALPPPQIGHRIRRCPFLHGSRPETLCLANPSPNFANDIFYNIDACKGCGMNEHDNESNL